MEELTIKSTIRVAQLHELSDEEQQLIAQAIEATNNSYAPYSNFHVGAAVRLENGETIMGCNQENAAFSVVICAERTAIFAAGAQHPTVPITTLAIAARTPDGQLQDEPVSPCGSCRQVIIETETRFHRPIRLLLYGRRCIYVVDGISQLMPLSFSQF